MPKRSGVKQTVEANDQDCITVGPQFAVGVSSVKISATSIDKNTVFIVNNKTRPVNNNNNVMVWVVVSCCLVTV